MFGKLFGHALPAGIIAGVFAAVLQLLLVSPLIIEAEKYEGGGAADVQHSQLQQQFDAVVAPALAEVTSMDEAGAWPEIQYVQDQKATGDENEPWMPESGFERSLYTGVMTIVTYVGFALVLVAGLALWGHAISARQGILWGLAGFAAVSLAPAVGLPPELPGASAAALEARQIWWVGTVLATAVGLWLSVFAGGNKVRLAAGLALIAVPHIIGAPHPAVLEGAVPTELSALFVGRSIGVAAVSWILLGALCGWFWERKEQAV